MIEREIEYFNLEGIDLNIEEIVEVYRRSREDILRDARRRISTSFTVNPNRYITNRDYEIAEAHERIRQDLEKTRKY